MKGRDNAMRRTSTLLAAIAALSLALAPGFADARAGGGGSFGSRGGMTFSAPPRHAHRALFGAADAAEPDAEHPLARYRRRAAGLGQRRGDRRLDRALHPTEPFVIG